ncbi:Rha family transcriptional regulator [Salinivibrio sp. VYel6]|jgi:hypothetical protein|uniref:Rha family transcriptional regulator n=1 Tax=Salinivibrio sp. VYel6 TaxID=2490493 RepID=UPI00128C306A|nr:Rha family transcriptional regulator [Salinivibrio sp. VYel6]MPX98074.1 Rha family transcriptional regulator [Salinivibrio sp. VYel6]
MAALQIAIDTPVCTKKEFLRRTGWSQSSLNRAIACGEIPVMPKASAQSAVLINMVKLAQRAAEQEA